MRSFKVTAVSESTRISVFSGLPSCIINSRQAPHGGSISPVFVTAMTFFAAYSPLVIIVDSAFRSAHIPSEQSVSIQTPVYTFPFSVSTAAPTPPEHICSDITFGTATASAAAYNFSHSVVIESPFRFTARFPLRC